MQSATFRLFLAALSAAAPLHPAFAAETPPVVLVAPQVLTLGQCPGTALQNNRRRPASRFALAMAEAQHRQALAGYWPPVTAKAGYFRLDESPNFIFPASTMMVPAQTVTVPAGTAMVTVSAGSLAPGFPPAPIEMPVSFPGQSITTAAQVFPIPSRTLNCSIRTTSPYPGTWSGCSGTVACAKATGSNPWAAYRPRRPNCGAPIWRSTTALSGFTTAPS